MIGNVKRIYKGIVKKLLLTFLILTMTACFAACGQKKGNDSTASYQIYFISADGLSVVSREYELDEMQPQETLGKIMTIMSLGAEEDNYFAPFSRGSKVIDTRIDDDTAVINMDAEYYSLSGIDEALIREAVVYTVTQIPGINKAQILVEGRAVSDADGNEIGVMTKADFISSDTGNMMPANSKDVTLYFKNKNKDALTAVSASISYSGNSDLCHAVINELIAGTAIAKENNVRPVINKNTKINSINVNNKICYVDFSEDYLKLDKAVKEEFAVYAVVNTLTTLDGIDGVVITIDGKSKEGFMAGFDDILHFNSNLN